MGVIVSKQHGINPSILVCPVCGKDYAIAVLGRLKGDKKAPMTMKGELCEECTKKYVTIFEVKEDSRERTGRCAYIPREALNENLDRDKYIMLESEFKKLSANCKSI